MVQCGQPDLGCYLVPPLPAEVTPRSRAHSSFCFVMGGSRGCLDFGFFLLMKLFFNLVLMDLFLVLFALMCVLSSGIRAHQHEVDCDFGLMHLLSQ